MTLDVTQAPPNPWGEQVPSLRATARAGLLFVGVLTGTSNGIVAASLMRHIESTMWFTAPAGTRESPDVALNRPVAIPPDASIPSNRSNAELLEHVRAMSGFTWDQISRLFNVSRRSVHLWLAGGRMSAGNEELLVRLVQLVDGLPAATPEQRRHLLLQPSGDGRSTFDSFRTAAASTDTDINRNLEPLAVPDHFDGSDLSGAG